MKRLLAILLLLAVPSSLVAQFKGTNGVAFGNAAALLGTDVFVIGRPGVTNYNLRGSNLLSFAGSVAAGNIGIGTASPGAKLHVAGDVVATNFLGPIKTPDGTWLKYAGDDSEIGSFDSTGAFDGASQVSFPHNLSASRFEGIGSNISYLTASQLIYGTVPNARLGTSGTRDATTYYRGDGVFESTNGLGVGAVTITNYNGAAGLVTGSGTRFGIGTNVGAASQTPWGSDINAAGFGLTNLAMINATNAQIANLTNETLTVSNVYIDRITNAFAFLNSTGKLVGTNNGLTLTNLNGSEIRSGTVAEARIDSAIARLASPTFTGTVTLPSGQALIAPALGTIASGNGVALAGVVHTNTGGITVRSGWNLLTPTSGTLFSMGDDLQLTGTNVLFSNDGGNTAAFSIGGGVITLPAQANPTTDADGEIALDTDGWGTGFDAFEVFNGTASAYLVATTASDAPSNGQVPKWNTGGSITWENDNGGGTTYTNNNGGAGVIVGSGIGTNVGTLSLTPWTSDIEAGSNNLYHVAAVSGRGGNTALVLQSNDTDASISLYNQSAAVANQYVATYGHNFIGPVTMTNLTGAASFTALTNTGVSRLAGIVADGWTARTNTWTTNTLAYAGTNFTAIVSANTGGGITGVGGTLGATELFTQITVKAVGDCVFTNPVAFYTSDGADTRTFTNGNLNTLMVHTIVGFSTNMVWSWSR